MRCAECGSNSISPTPREELWAQFAAAALAGILTHKEVFADTVPRNVQTAADLADTLLAEYEARFGKVEDA